MRQYEAIKGIDFYLNDYILCLPMFATQRENVSFADMVKVLLITLAGRGPFKPYAFLYSRRLSPDTTVRMLRSISLRAVALFSLISEHVPEERVFFLAVDVSSEAMLHLIHHLSSNQ